MKQKIILLICIISLIYTSLNANKISTYIASIISSNQKLIINDSNEYTKKESFLYMNYTEDYVPYSYNDLINIIYSVIDNGWDNFTFYCPSEYDKCINDIEQISTDNNLLIHINNFVHPFNSFTQIGTQILESGEVTLTIKHLYSQDQIKAIDTEVKRVISLITDKSNTDKENIKAIHDYIINNTKYDSVKASSGDSNYASEIAYGTLFDHYATCNGYTDTMAIFLTELGIKNYKISTTSEDLKKESVGHIWNAVFIDNQWYHLDLTWDDPVTDDGKDYLYYKYFLITSSELAKADSGDVEIEDHNFNKKIYLEFNDSIKEQIS